MMLKADRRPSKTTAKHQVKNDQILPKFFMCLKDNAKTWLRHMPVITKIIMVLLKLLKHVSMDQMVCHRPGYRTTYPETKCWGECLAIHRQANNYDWKNANARSLIGTLCRGWGGCLQADIRDIVMPQPDLNTWEAVRTAAARADRTVMAQLMDQPSPTEVALAASLSTIHVHKLTNKIIAAVSTK